MNIEISTKNMAFLECLASKTRVKMIELLDERPRNIKEMAEMLGISSAIVTKHVQKLEEAEIIACEKTAGKRGTQKICSLQLDRATLQFKINRHKPNHYQVSLPVGQYSSHDVKPTCGLVSPTRHIGIVDDPRYFADPEHVQACHIWFGSGWVEYRIPNFLLSSQQLRSLEITLEICSEAPGYNENWPSDITFYLNGISVGTWTCPGDYGSNRGAFTPFWWNRGTQHGLLKKVSVTREGSFIDGVALSGVTVGDLGIAYGREIPFRLYSAEDAGHCGGISLFGKGFGNYDTDIEVTVGY